MTAIGATIERTEPRPTMAPRTQLILTAPILPTLLRIAAPNVLLMAVQAAMVAVDAFYIGWLGPDALAGMALVLPVMMLAGAMSMAALGGGIASAIARALGAGDRERANALAFHGLVLAALVAAAFTFVLLVGGHALYTAMGGRGAALAAALAYSNIAFGGTLALWMTSALSSVLRGAGNLLVPSVVMIAGEVLHAGLAPVLIFGWGPAPALGVSGAALSLVITLALRVVVLAGYFASRRSVVVPRLGRSGLSRAGFADILGVALPAGLNTILANGYILLLTAMVATFGATTLAGYGLGARLEYVVIPLVFGFGGATIPMVGMNIGAGQIERARRIAWVGAALAGLVAGGIGLTAAIAPWLWLRIFSSDPAVLASGKGYLQIVGPTYVFLGVGQCLYFASQGAARLFWPLVAGALRLVVAVGLAGLAVFGLGAGPSGVFVASAIAMILYGGAVALAVWRSDWRPRVATKSNPVKSKFLER